MKYMGSKRLMLKNGLGQILKREIVNSNRFVDIFVGSGAVAKYVAENFNIQVQASDIQLYSAILSNAIISREKIINWQPIWNNWEKNARELFKMYKIPSTKKITQPVVKKYRVWCERQENLPITKAYGGHYFSPLQAVWIDALRTTLPEDESTRIVALAALIQAASQCAAAPGHTAQPFQPTRTAKPFLIDAWGKDIVKFTKDAFRSLSNRVAKKKGKAEVADANQVAEQLIKGDLVFIDPPYSGVHYSRFYHVLETIAQGGCGDVTGVGRYPDAKLRPRSDYSMRSGSLKALDGLLNKIANKGAKAILTFPDRDCSNGLSGNAVRETASKYFQVEEHSIKSKFSTLGGNSNSEKKVSGRDARQHVNELILILKPKKW